MDKASTINSIGHYCGRFSDGFWGEPQNSLTNLLFIIGAAYAWRVRHKQKGGDIWQLVIIALAALIGVGSFTFHSFPTSTTLLIDLIPIQIFSIFYFGYVGIGHLHAPTRMIVLTSLSFMLVRFGWIAMMPKGSFGGGVSHIPALVLLFILAVCLHRKRNPLAIFLFLSSMTYLLALIARCLDLPLCSTFPFGFHWLWHVLTGVTASILVYGIVRVSADAVVPRESNMEL